MCPPPVKYKSNRGTKKSKKGQESDVHRDPFLWEYDEGLEGSQTMKKSCTKPSGSQPSSKSSRLLYLSQFLVLLYQNIDDIVETGEDVNCDFRAIPCLLG